MKKALTKTQTQELLTTLQNRFQENLKRHPKLQWQNIETKLQNQPEKLFAIYQMEATGGEPDVLFHDPKTDQYTFIDCSPESPKGRRSLCYDRPALDARKNHKPANSAIDLATDMNVEILNEQQYRQLQEHGDFDLKTSSWIQTPTAIRQLGGALFCDKRYKTTFTYHNGADSYYGSRGFRAMVKV